MSVIRRVYNNNLVLLQDVDGREVIAIGRGIGYNRRPGDAVAPGAIERRFVPESPARLGRIVELLSEAPIEHVEVAAEIVARASAVLDIDASQALLLAVLDHLNFSVQRTRAGETMDFPLRWEVQQVYPNEVAAGQGAVELIHSRLGIQLQTEEASAFALHFVASQMAKPDISRVVQMTQTISGIFSILETAWQVPIDQNSMTAGRFVTHLRYLFKRMQTHKQLDGSSTEVLAVLGTSNAAVMSASREVATRLETDLRGRLTPDEAAYLTLYIGRLHADLFG